MGVVVPILAGRKEYLILGLGCTIFFVLIGDIVSMQALLHMTDISFINLCYVLIIGYITLYKKRPPTLFEQGTYLVAWIVSTLINNIPTLLPKPINHFEPLTGFVVIVLIIGIAQPIKRLLQKN